MTDPVLPTGAATYGAVTAGPGAPLSGPGVLHAADARAERVHSFDPAAFAVPTGREEDWRFTPLDRLRGLHAHPIADGKVVVDVDAPAEVAVETVGRDDPRVGTAFVPGDRVSATAYAGFGTATVLSVPAEVRAGRPTFVTVRGEGGTAFGHLRISLGPFAEAVVVLDHQGSVTLADNVEIVVGDGARLTLVSVQDWADDTVHLSYHAARVGRDARLRHVAVALGGDLVRLAPTVQYAGPGGDAELLGLFFADAHQHLEHRLFVEHGQPHCRSRVAYKGALQGEGAHTVWIGDVLVRKAAEGTDTYELNRNLVLTDGARADSVPNLELETGEIVGAGHASATGRFDDEQLFYLMARGIPADVARRLVVRGFFAEVIDAIGVPELAERLAAAIDGELERSLQGATA
jgi:Fe-S cluster assembly protein SufD